MVIAGGPSGRETTLKLPVVIDHQTSLDLSITVYDGYVYFEPDSQTYHGTYTGTRTFNLNANSDRLTIFKASSIEISNVRSN